MGDLPENAPTNGVTAHIPIKYFKSANGKKRLVKPRQYQMAELMADDLGTLAIARQLKMDPTYCATMRHKPYMVDLANEIKAEKFKQQLDKQDEVAKTLKVIHLSLDHMVTLLESGEKLAPSLVLRMYEAAADRAGLPKKSVSNNTKTVISADIGTIAERLAAARKRADARKPEVIQGTLANETRVTEPAPSVEPSAPEEAASDAD